MRRLPTGRATVRQCAAGLLAAAGLFAGAVVAVSATGGGAAPAVAAPVAQATPTSRTAGRDVDTVAELATRLGVDRATMKTALEGARQDVKAATPGKQPGGKPLVAALAKRLGLPEERVQAACEAVRTAHRGQPRPELEKRLAAAVKAGKITQAEMDSVLKAYDAGALGHRRAA